MEVFIYSIAALVAILMIFLLVERPFYLGGIIIFMLLYQFNVETPLPLDARGLLTLALFIRLYIFDKDNMFLVNNYLFTNKIFWLLSIFLLVILVVPLISSQRLLPFAKEIILAGVNIILGFIIVKNKEGRKALVYGVIVAGFFSSVDLVFTFFTTGSLQIIKLIDTVLGRPSVLLNHNYPGLLASMGLLCLYFLWYRSRLSKMIILPLIAFLSVSVIISTSRSTILAFFLVFILVSIFESDLKHNLKKLIPLSIVLVLFLVGFFFTYNVFFGGSGSGSYLDKIYYRLYEEPFKMISGEASEFDKYSGQRVKGSMTFRAERWGEDFTKFTKLDLVSQFIGLGPKGYLEIAEKVYKDSGYLNYQLASHNGYLLILLERGIIGLLIFLFIVISLSINSIKLSKEYQIIFPMIYLLLMLVLYSFAQNSELTSSYSYLIIGAVIGNVIHSEIELIAESEEEYEVLEN